uniref:Cadherin domain-containing protein n=1 Tax=Lates calcarifer TaxID=8187 RepID=A0A4W6EMK7_LATCA
MGAMGPILFLFVCLFFFCQEMKRLDQSMFCFVFQIRSDFENNGNIRYSLEGVGANQYPFHVFVVDPKTGLIRVTKVLDREFIDTYNLSGVATFTDGREAEKKIDVRIKVVDENDNSPVFGVTKPMEVDELSPAGTSVMKITATDADEPGNKNSQIGYSIVNQNPSDDMFYMTNDGTIYVKKPFLDREKVAQYILTVKGQDLNGEPGGNSATTTVTINVRDVNDNLPTLEKEEYEGSIEENTEDVEVMRIKAEDLDLEGTDNWEAVFDIVKGNEAGYFSITTDPKTNEGILMLDKAVDYEDVKDLELGLAVRNKAPPFDGSGATGASGASGATGASGGSSWQSGTTFKTYPIKINVKNQPEGPRFDPKVKAIPISEGDHSVNIKDVIAENVRYAKGSDPDNWLTIDPKTADIRLNKIPDRESPFLVNGTYMAKVLCISEDMPGKTATGTIAIQVEDFNDHCPKLTSDIQTMCTMDDNVIVNAKDEDAFPNGPPFHFSIVPEGTEGKWHIERLNDTAAILRAEETLWPGSYEVEFEVKDEQGEACPEPQKVKVQVCTCEDGVVCGKRGSNGQPSKGVELGPAGIGLLFLGLLLLALIPLLLLFCQCGGAGGLPGGFTEMPFDTKSHLINYRTEGQGESTEVPLLNMPTQMDGDRIIDMGMVGLGLQKSVTSMNGMNRVTRGEGFASDHREGTWGMNHLGSSGFYSEFEGRESGGGGGIYDGMALPDHFLAQYYTKKVSNGNENPGVKDALLVYDYEGEGSSVGSVGCCSLLESDNDLQFLDGLGPKFKTLAEVCGGKMIPTEVKQVFTPLPSASINTQISESNLMTGPQPPLTTVVREKSERSQTVKESMAMVRGEMANQGQMLMLQQQHPVYYTTAPVMQPMHYVVQPQVQNTMLLAEAPATNLQGMVLVNSTQAVPAQGMVVQGQTVMSSGQSQGPSMVLVERSGIQGGGTNLINIGNLSGSQTMTMKVLKGSQTCLAQGGTLPAGGLSGSRKVLEAGGLSKKSDVSGSQRNLYRKDNTSTGLQSSVEASSTTIVSTIPTYHKVQETREIH